MLGETISHFRIIEKLGHGGMGEVYLAEDTRLGRRVALKFLAPELARDRESLIRFRNEARAAAELSHPNIATIYDFDEVDGRPFLILEYLEGQTLRERSALGPLPIEDVLRIGKALAAGLIEAHSHGIVHRDIKSANVMITGKGEVKILDFGLAHRADATQITREGTTLGTIGYMSPEQARGETADERSDIWSLGVVLYECLTGRLPFLGDGASILEQIKAAGAKPPTALRTGVPMELEQAVLRCLEKDSQLRYQHADDLLAKLMVVESHLQSSGAAGIPAATTQSTATGAGWRGPRNLLLAVAIVIVAVTLSLRPWVKEEAEPVAEPDSFSVAVIDFQDASIEGGVTPGLTMTNLVQGSLIESSPCRVLTLEYLKSIRQRLFGTSTGPIPAEQALEIARAAGASSLVLADMIESGDHIGVSWRLVDTADGEALGAGRCESSRLFDVADSTVAGIVPVLARSCGEEAPPQQVPVVSITTQSEAAYHHYLVGTDAQENYQLEVAQEELFQAVALDSTFALAWFALSHIASALGQMEDRARYSGKAWEMRGHMDLRNRLRLEAWLRSSEYDLRAAMSVYREILDRWPDDRDSLGEFIYTSYLYWLMDETVEFAARAARLYPDDSSLVSYWASALGNLGRHREAVSVLQAHLQRYPEHLSTWSNLGLGYLYLGNPDSARVAFDRALEIDPDFFGSQKGLAYVAFARGDLPRAIELLETMLGKYELNALKRPVLYVNAFYLGLTELTLMTGELQRSRDYFNQSLEVTDDPMEQRRTFGRFALKNGEPGVALSIAAELANSDERRSRQMGIRLRARALVALDSLDQAKEAVDDLLQWAESDGNLYLYFARRVTAEIALKENRPEDALVELRAIFETGILWGSWAMECRELEAESLRRLHRYDEAVDVLREQLRVWGGRAIDHYQLAQIYEEMGQESDAETEYARFLEMWTNADEGLPELEDARQRLESLRARL